MNSNKKFSYLRSYRLRWGLSQRELANLLGCKSPGIISKLEKSTRVPSVKVVIGCFILFGTRAAELFPGVFDGVESGVMKRVWEMYEKTQGSNSKMAKTKMELFEDAIERERQRNERA
ncbi:helix-turn-helix domain-containing protein [Bradyrhizobium japonicum]|uniref:helix-turn-helix domain-containing protein n=1 Tax=Bradyrhizobium japonicum TaxID=375 RepID=UPI001BAE0221|nr:helix-turn-helix transcriptional regulator [Bradyrhizobium japonicum]MBR0960904.1 helix-turn-helix transcriptional regulator [Bradyrhizobium japonicum]